MLLVLLAGIASAQIVWTAPVPPQAAVPGKLVLTDDTAGNPTVACTFTGNAVPATAIIVSCSVGSTITDSYTLQFSPGIARTISVMFNANSITATFSSPPTGGIAVQASIHAATPVAQGTF